MLLAAQLPEEELCGPPCKGEVTERREGRQAASHGNTEEKNIIQDRVGEGGWAPR